MHSRDSMSKVNNGKKLGGGFTVIFGLLCTLEYKKNQLNFKSYVE